MKTVTLLVAQQLGSRDDIRKTEFGVSITHRYGVTELLFYRGNSVDGTGATAILETRFAPGSVPDFTSEQIARVNRRTVYGIFYQPDEQLRCRLAFPLRDPEPDAAWIAEYLVTAFFRQGEFGFRTVWAETSKTEFLAARTDLAAPRQWTAPLPDMAFEEVAQRLEDEGQAARARPGGLCIPVALDDVGILQGGDDAGIDITTTIEHPLAGTGYLATLTLPPLQLWHSGDLWCFALNAQEDYEGDFAPRLGAWALRGGGGGAEIVHGFFLPAQEGSAALLDRIARWMLWRAEWIRDTYWEPGIGLTPRDDADE